MAFQMGVDGLLKFKNTLELIKNGKYKEASDAMLDSLWAKQTPNRASRLSAQMKTGEWV
jgi:lysozyme